MKITKRQLRRIIKEEKAVLEQSWRQNPAKIRRERRERDRQRMIDQMTFKQLKRSAFDSALFIQGRLDTGQYEYADIWEVEIPRLADYIDAAKVKAAEEGVTYDDIPEIRHNGGIVDLSRYSLGLPDGIKENTMKITKSELRQIIKEELQLLGEESFDAKRDAMARRGTYGAYKSRRAPSMPPAEELSPEEMALNAKRAEALEKLRSAAHRDQYDKVGNRSIDTGHRGQKTSMSPDKAYKSAMGALNSYKGASDPKNRFGNVKDVSHHDMARIRHALEVYGLDGADLFVYQG